MRRRRRSKEEEEMRSPSKELLGSRGPKAGQIEREHPATSVAGHRLRRTRSTQTLQAPPTTRKCGPAPDAKSAGAPPSSTNQEEVRRAFGRKGRTQTGSVAVYLRNGERHHGGLRASSKGAPETKRRCRAWRHQAVRPREPLRSLSSVPLSLF